jgi:uncharacterized protein YdeI (YjbR/CyaY-like superfamily)
MKPRAFKTPVSFRAWLDQNHASCKELILRLFKVHARHKGIGYGEALDEALCHGWIDGVRRSWDADSFTVRFTPRKATSMWSAVNIRHIARLKREGRVHPHGLAIFHRRDREKSGYSYETLTLALDRAALKTFRANKAAWTFFEAQPPGYKRIVQYMVMSAKRPETRAKRLKALIACSAKGERIGMLAKTKAPARQRP